ncbi:hypothetical protein GOBAR_AA18679 [Gossypium barbadense]|uniref:RRM domain-containing protein n=1 Tax=Gossypium barbadense TaxID=3634 RepID=A0A2P5XF76_GOSBA|nr:hypothetical protein GOBAR_AA18679 [Gossypium barbadense]
MEVKVFEPNINTYEWKLVGDSNDGVNEDSPQNANRITLEASDIDGFDKVNNFISYLFLQYIKNLSSNVFHIGMECAIKDSVDVFSLSRNDDAYSQAGLHNKNLMARPPYEYDPYYLQPDQDRNLINTLFVSGLPDDVKAREIHNLFRRRAGFDYCQLKYTGRGNQVVAFATFAQIHQLQSQQCMQLNGVYSTGSPERLMLPAANEQLERTIDEGAQACSTLFIANLGPNCTEYELKQVLSKYPGFNMLKIRAKGGMPVAFADFELTFSRTASRTSNESDDGSSEQPFAFIRPRQHAHRVCKVQDEEALGKRIQCIRGQFVFAFWSSTEKMD